jgi:hypothetical protein
MQRASFDVVGEITLDRMSKLHYLAYGSNLHPLRLAARVPSARPLGVVEMPGYALAFHKRSIDGSGKCLMYTEQGAHRKMYGVLYEFEVREKAGLDALEGKGKGYIEQFVQFPLNGETYTPYVYVAQASHVDASLIPYDWYKGLVLVGAKYHKLPEDYIAEIDATPSKPDPDTKRSRENEDLIKRLGAV